MIYRDVEVLEGVVKLVKSHASHAPFKGANLKDSVTKKLGCWQSVTGRR